MKVEAENADAHIDDLNALSAVLSVACDEQEATKGQRIAAGLLLAYTAMHGRMPARRDVSAVVMELSGHLSKIGPTP